MTTRNQNSFFQRTSASCKVTYQQNDNIIAWRHREICWLRRDVYSYTLLLLLDNVISEAWIESKWSAAVLFISE